MAAVSAADGVVAGGCLCGAVRFALRGRLRPVVVCHCGQCRRWHGHAGAYTELATEDLSLTADADLAWFRSSDIARRGFCRLCGSSLFWQRHGATRISVAAGTLDAPTGLATASQIFADDKGDYYALDPRVPDRD
jgi:hypothetical protein